MRADTLLVGISQLVTAEGDGVKHGRAMRELKIVESAAVGISSGIVVWTGRESEWVGDAETVVDAGERAVVPGLVDPHTHAIWAGDRLKDFEARASGLTYEEILAGAAGYEARFALQRRLRRMSWLRWRRQGLIPCLRPGRPRLRSSLAMDLLPPLSSQCWK